MQQENDNQGSVGLSPFGNVRSRKDAHKCQHCGKFISGHVAYRGETTVLIDAGEKRGSIYYDQSLDMMVLAFPSCS